MALRILAVVAGLLAGMMVNLGLILASSTLFPLPDGADTNTVAGLQRLAEYIATLPVSAFVLVLAAHQVGAFIGGLVTASIAQSSWLWDSLAVGIVFLLLGGLNLLQIPHPLGFALVDLLFYIPMAIAGGSLARYVLPADQRVDGLCPYVGQSHTLKWRARDLAKKAIPRHRVRWNNGRMRSAGAPAARCTIRPRAAWDWQRR